MMSNEGLAVGSLVPAFFSQEPKNTENPAIRKNIKYKFRMRIKSNECSLNLLSL